MSVSSAKSGTARTRAATEAQLARFKTPEERTEYFRALGQKSAEGRVVLPADQVQQLAAHAEALANAYDFLRTIAKRADHAAA